MDTPLLRVLVAVPDTQEFARVAALLPSAPDVGYQLDWAGTSERAHHVLCARAHDVCLLDAALDPRGAARLIAEARVGGCLTPVILLFAPPGDGGDVAAIQAGATDCLARQTLTPELLARTVRYAIERARASVALLESEQRKSAILDAAVDAILSIDEHGRIIEFNRAAERTFGFRHEEAMGQRMVDLIVPPSFRDAHRAGFARYLATGEARLIGRRIEIVGCRADGSEFPIELTITRTQLGIGPIFSAQIRDITDRKFTEAALWESETRAREFVDRAIHGIFRASSEGRLLGANPALVKMLGYEAEADVVGLSLERDVYLNATDCRAFISDLERTGARSEMEAPWRRQTGELITVRVRGRAILSEDGRLEALEAVAEDVTERKLLEQQLLQAQKMETVGQLAGGIAHDFNNLLTAILGYSDLLLDEMHPEDRRRDHLGEIRRAAERAAGLTRQLLAFSRQQILRPVAMDLGAAIVGLSVMIRRLIGEHINVLLRLAPETRPILADPGQIEQVIVNLAVNARDAMPGGGALTFETRDIPESEAHPRPMGLNPGPYVLLRVTDTGVGMTPDVMSHMFEPFFTTKDPGKGTGLGLATVYGIVKQSDGDITVRSAPGEGTTFSLYFPQASGQSAESREARIVHSGGAETVLLVEDEASVRALVTEVLKRRGYRVLTADNGDRALEIAEGRVEPIDLLLTDVVMRGMSGRELANRLLAVRPGTKVLFMSGYTDDAIVHHGVLDPGTEFLQKPFTPDALNVRIRQVLDS